jgi:hypothetical protein
MPDDALNTSDSFVSLAEILEGSHWDGFSDGADRDLAVGGSEPSLPRPGRVGQHRRRARRSVGTLLMARGRVR